MVALVKFIRNYSNVAFNDRSIIALRDHTTVDLYDARTYVFLSSIIMLEPIVKLIAYANKLLVVTLTSVYTVSDIGLIKPVFDGKFAYNLETIVTPRYLYLITDERYYVVNRDISLHYSVHEPSHVLIGHNGCHITVNHELYITHRGRNHPRVSDTLYDLGVCLAFDDHRLYYLDEDVGLHLIDTYKHYKIIGYRFLVYSTDRILNVYDLVKHVLTDTATFTNDIIKLRATIYGISIVFHDKTFYISINHEGLLENSIYHETQLYLYKVILPWIKEYNLLFKGFEDLMIKTHS